MIKYTFHKVVDAMCRRLSSIRLQQVCFYIAAIVVLGSCTFYSQLTITAFPENAGGVFVATDSTTKPTEYTESATKNQGKFLQPNHAYYCYAQTTDTNYLWAGWFKEDKTTLISTNQDGDSISVTTTSQDDKNPVEYNYFALWVIPKVTAVKPESTEVIKITDPTSMSDTVHVTFTLEDDVAADNFNLTETGDPFYYGDVSYTTGSYAVPFIYNITGIHNAGINGGEQTPNEGTLTLTSKYKGSDSSPTSQTATIQVIEDYTPEFTTIDNYTATSIGEHLITALIPSGLNYAATNGEWNFSIKDESHPGYFNVNSNPTKDDVTVLFAPAVNENATCTATFVITCTYTDRAPVPNRITTTKEIPISITLQKVENPVLQFIDMETGEDISSMAMGEAQYPNSISKSVRLSKALVSSITYEWIGNTNDYFAYSADESNSVISISLAGNTPIGAHSATLKVSATTEQGGTITDEVNISAKVILATPALEGFGRNDEVLLVWEAIAGVSGYRIKYAQTADAKLDNLTSTYPTSGLLPADATEQIIQGLTNYKQYSFVLIAVYSDAEEYNKSSNIVTVVPVSPPDVITISNAMHTGIYTGTEKNGDFPYKTKREIDVSAAFAGDKAIFDRLYIFGLTVGDNNDSVTYDNATTQCYIYNRIDGETYSLQPASTKQIVENMNTESKNTTYFNIEANNQKIYFTGYCPYASTGITWEENAVVYITGDGTKSIDIYIDSLQLYSRMKDSNGTTTRNVTSEEAANDIIGTGVAAMQGSGAVFTVNSTSANFAPKFHICGHNTFKAEQGMSLYLNVKKSIFFNSVTLTGTYTQSSSPIQCLITGNNQSTQLTIDDVWPTNVAGTTITNTNGVLLLKKTDDVSGVTTAPLIDLGNADAQLNINGGQIYFENTDNMPIIAYRMMVRTDKVSGNTLTNYLYGTCNVTGYNQNQTSHTNMETLHDGGVLRIQDGTINSASGVSTLKCPTNTTIDGGSFNCDIQAGSATNITNSDGLALHKFTATMQTAYGQVVNGKAEISNFGKLVDDLFPLNDNSVGAGYIDGCYHRMLSMYYVGNRKYGYSSLAPDNDNLYLMLPYYSGYVHFALRICAPEFVATVRGVPTNLGGGINHVEAATDTIDRLLYMEIDDFTRQVLDGYNAPNNVVLTLDVDKPNYETIDEAETYKVDGKVYMLKPIVADEWMLFTPPFDVANVYVIESYPEKQLKKDYKAVRGQIPSENVVAARKEQAKRLLDLYLFWYYEEMGIGAPYDFFDKNSTTDIDGDGTSEPYGKFVLDWMAHEKANKIDASAADNAYMPSVEKLQHFTGDNASSAHYYLYHATDNWAFDNSTQKFSAEEAGGWEYVDVSSNGDNTIMEKEKVYAIYFPHNVIGGKHDPSTNWDYWTGKYLLIESIDKVVSNPANPDSNDHWILGSNYANTVLQGEVSTGVASMRGNATFAELSNLENNPTATLWTLEKDTSGDRDKHDFVRNMDGGLRPTEGCMLANVPAPAGMRARTINYKTGEVTYESTPENEDTSGISTDVPTIMGDITLVVIPTEEGLTIQPLKAQHVMLLDAAGHVLLNQYLNEEICVNLLTGVYIVRGEYEQVKVVKK